jgi:hypothetical protein
MSQAESNFTEVSVPLSTRIDVNGKHATLNLLGKGG